MILEEGNKEKALEYVRKIVKKIKTRKIDRKDLIIKTQLKKPISEYKAISPHVVAARRMQELGIPVSQGNLIEYYISEIEGKGKKLGRLKLGISERDLSVLFTTERLK